MVLEYKGERRIVTQYQFLKWPDFDVPQNPGEVLEFLGIVHNKYMEVDQTRRGPIGIGFQFDFSHGFKSLEVLARGYSVAALTL